MPIIPIGRFNRLWSIVLLCVFSTPIWSAERRREDASSKVAVERVDHRMGPLRISALSMIREGDVVRVSFEAQCSHLHTNYCFSSIPTIVGIEGSSQRLALPPLTIRGKRYERSRIRRSIRHTGEPTSEEGRLLTSFVAGRSVHYSVEVPYEEWMHRVALTMERTLEGCCRKERLLDAVLVEEVVFHHELEPMFDTTRLKVPESDLEWFARESPFLYSSKDYPNRNYMSDYKHAHDDLVIYFARAYTRIDPTFRTNEETLSKLNKTLELIEADGEAHLKKIVIVGLSSPEGTFASNTILAEKRAQALKNYLSDRLPYDPSLFEIINGSEDWEGLKRLVSESQMPSRWEVLEIIDRYPVMEGREKKLMDLDGGVPYRYMLTHFFPELRNASYVQIYYEDNRKRSTDSHEFNVALEWMREGKYSEAAEKLLMLGDVGRAGRRANLLGVCYMMMGELERAEVCFDEALLAGDPDAIKNKEQLQIARVVSASHHKEGYGAMEELEDE